MLDDEYPSIPGTSPMRSRSRPRQLRRQHRLPIEPELAARLAIAAVLDGDRAGSLASVLVGRTLAYHCPCAVAPIVLILRVERHGVTRGLPRSVGSHQRG